MVFSSTTFLFFFLPLTLVLYFLVPSKTYRNIALLVVSLVFYAWGEPVYVLLMMISIAVNWAAGVLMEKLKNRKTFILVSCLIVDLAILGFFKYEGFLAIQLNEIAGIDIVPVLDLPLPIGISFYTLQAISYVVDVHKGAVPAQRNILFLGMYIAMFPQLVAGPIVRYSTVWKQIVERKTSIRKFCSGIRLFCIGLAKKVLLANTVALLADKILNCPGGAAEVGMIGVWGGVIAFTFQIFFDFAGYSDMAIGLGKMFGFDYLRNFNYPYISKSVTEFWRRWHISLGSFFRDYVYIPLGGNRVSRTRWVLNVFMVWFLTGFWHGAAYNFILWGLYYGILLAIEKMWLLDKIKRAPALVAHLYSIVVFVFGWLLFWVEDISQLYSFILAMFGAYGLTGTSTMWELSVWEYWPVFILCGIASTPVIPWLRERIMAWGSRSIPKSVFAEGGLANGKMLSATQQCDVEDWADSLKAHQGFRSTVARYCLIGTNYLCLALLVLSVMALISGSFNPFIYFRF